MHLIRAARVTLKRHPGSVREGEGERGVVLLPDELGSDFVQLRREKSKAK